MNCKKYSRKIDNHEEALLAQWRELTDIPAPDILPQLADRLDALRQNPAVPTPPARKGGYFGPILTAAGATLGVACLFVGMQKHKEEAALSYAALPQPPLARQAATDVPANQTSLATMLTEVRWRSSDERQIGREPHSYNEATRALLVSEKGNKK